MTKRLGFACQAMAAALLLGGFGASAQTPKLPPAVPPAVPPASPQTPATPPASAQAPAKATLTTGGPVLEVLGAKIGMSSADVKKAWTAAGYDAGSIPEKSIINNFQETAYVSEISGQRTIDASGIATEMVTASFFGPGNPGLAWRVTRSTQYGGDPKVSPTTKVVVDALLAKYGPPTMDKSTASNRTLIWWWGPNGERTKDTPARTCEQIMNMAGLAFRGGENFAATYASPFPNAEKAGCHKAYVAEVRFLPQGFVTVLNASAFDIAAANAASAKTVAMIDKLEAAKNAKQQNQATQNKPQL